MVLATPGGGPLATDAAVYGELLPLAGARILELGCGKAEHTRRIAAAHPDATIVAMEIDAVQHAQNIAAAAPPNLRFAPGGAEAVDAADASFDIVMMFKSLHHVPGALLGRAMREIHRVLVPGGLAYLAEPVFAGEYNEVIRLFNDEQVVRAAAFDAIGAAIDGGLFELDAERFFRVPQRFADFDDFARRLIGVSYMEHRLSAEQLAAVRARFERSLTAEGALFEQEMRVDLLRKR